METPCMAYAIKTGPGRRLTIVGLWSRSGIFLRTMTVRDCQVAYPDLHIVFTRNAHLVKPRENVRQLDLFSDGALTVPGSRAGSPGGSGQSPGDR